MFDKTGGGDMFPKFVREYVEKIHEVPWEELSPIGGSLCKDLFWEACEEKYGPLYE